MSASKPTNLKVVRGAAGLKKPWPKALLWHGDAAEFLDKIPRRRTIDLVITSPPYNIGKSYESKRRQPLNQYLLWQASIIERVVPLLNPGASVCWQVGNYVENGFIEPLDMHLHSVFREFGFVLRNRIVWRYGHGLHCKRRFSGRYEVVLWYTLDNEYTFNLDAVRVPSKYPGKRSYRAGQNGRLTSNPAGKNPEDVWDIPNVKGRHKEKTTHPCQFPVGLAERLVLALSNPRQRVFDPFMGVGSAGVAALVHKRSFVGCEVDEQYVSTAKARLTAAFKGTASFRPHNQPIYDHRKSPLSRRPSE